MHQLTFYFCNVIEVFGWDVSSLLLRCTFRLVLEILVIGIIACTLLQTFQSCWGKQSGFKSKALVTQSFRNTIAWSKQMHKTSTCHDIIAVTFETALLEFSRFMELCGKYYSIQNKHRHGCCCLQVEDWGGRVKLFRSNKSCLVAAQGVWRCGEKTWARAPLEFYW